MTTRGKTLSVLLLIAALALMFAFMKSCQGADGDVDDTDAGPRPTSLRVEAPRPLR